jgi:threonyl-tRNA synthetase
MSAFSTVSTPNSESRATQKAAMEKVTEALQKTAIGGGDKKPKKEKKAPAEADASAGPLELQPPPAFIQERIDLFDRLYKEQQEELARKPHDDILITMPDGTVKPGKAYETTPAEIAKGISNSLYKRTVVARIDGEHLWDLERPLEKSCKLELLDFNDEQGKFVFCNASLRLVTFTLPCSRLTLVSCRAL